MKIVVTGGAGYIGSHTCKVLAQKKHTPIVIDNLVYGHEESVKWGPLYKEDILNTESLTQILVKEKPDAIIHFAAYAYVGESVTDPLKYYRNNVIGSLSLLNAMKQAGVNKLVFSSTCATYGIPTTVPIHEEHPQNPINPYGQTKLNVEKILIDFGFAYNLKSVALRYFNAAGADKDGEIGEEHDPETHLIPLAIQATLNPNKPLTVMGTDYSTKDGTCIRDYIHVTDLAEAHVLALEYLYKAETNFSYFNLGTGQGASVNDVISMVEKVSGKKVRCKHGERRPGDPPVLVADGEKAKSILGWNPKHSSLENIISTAFRWHQQRNLTK